MSDAACKAAICENEAQNKLVSACDNIQSLKGQSAELRIECAEIYLKAAKKATQAVMKKITVSSQTA